MEGLEPEAFKLHHSTRGIFKFAHVASGISMSQSLVQSFQTSHSQNVYLCGTAQSISMGTKYKTTPQMGGYNPTFTLYKKLIHNP